MRRILVAVTAVAVAAASWTLAVAGPAGAVGETWTVRNAPDSSWRALAFDGSTTVAVADGGADRVAYTVGGTQAVAASAPEQNGWTSVTYASALDLFVAVAHDGVNRVMTSPDGIVWTARSAPASAWQSVTWSPDLARFVAVASDGTNRVMTSPDGVVWTVRTAAASHLWTSVTWIAGSVDRFVAVSADGADRVMTSPDGVTWTLSGDAADTDNGAWTSVTSDGTTLVAVGSSGANRVMTSTDGTSWTPGTAAAANAWTSVTADGAGRFVAVASTGTNRVMVSTDSGATWTGYAAAQNNAWTAVGPAAGGLLLAVSADGVQRAMSSSDGTSWDALLTQARGWRSVTFGDGLFAAVSAVGSVNRVMTSPDGVSWTLRAAGAASAWSAVTFGDDRFVAVASEGPNLVMSSTDGITWDPHVAAAPNLWTDVTYGNGLFVAVSFTGSDRVMTSPDGVNWTLSGDAGDTDDGAWSAVAFGGDRFVAVSVDGKVMSSADGTQWDLHVAPAANAWQSVAYGGGRFVATSSNGTDRVMTSTNGTAWTASGDPAVTDDAPWNALTYGEGTFVAVPSNGGPVMTSTDGLDWTAHPITTGDLWDDVTHASGIFVAVAGGPNSRIMTSGTFFLPPEITSFDPVAGPIGATVTITGANLAGATAVSFDGVEATEFVVESPTTITVVVPEDATTGVIRVTTPGGTATSDDVFTVTAAIRLWGPDEIDTSIAISERAFPTEEPADDEEQLTAASAVVLARNDFFADALTGGPLAALVNGPMLITYGAPTASGGSLPGDVADEIDRLLDPGDTVYILGGTLAVSQGVEDQLDAAGYDVERLWGDDQFGTAVAIADEIADINPPKTIFEATGYNSPDALSAVPAAIARDGVILLTRDNVQASETEAWIDAHESLKRYSIGGELVAGGADPGATNVSGQDLFGTSSAVATRFFPNPKQVGVATGATFPDALSGGVFMATDGRSGPMLLVNPVTPLPPSIEGYLDDVAIGTLAYVFGGVLAVSNDVVDAVTALIAS